MDSAQALHDPQTRRADLDVGCCKLLKSPQGKHSRQAGSRVADMQNGVLVPANYLRPCQHLPGALQPNLLQQSLLWRLLK